MKIVNVEYFFYSENITRNAIQGRFGYQNLIQMMISFHRRRDECDDEMGLFRSMAADMDEHSMRHFGIYDNWDVKWICDESNRIEMKWMFLEAEPKWRRFQCKCEMSFVWANFVENLREIFQNAEMPQRIVFPIKCNGIQNVKLDFRKSQLEIGCRPKTTTHQIALRKPIAWSTPLNGLALKAFRSRNEFMPLCIPSQGSTKWLPIKIKADNYNSL